jgi:drug/metabolite transporter (DMT)-like permease
MFAMLSAVLVAAASITEKKTLMKEHAMEFAAVLAVTNLFLSLFLIPKVSFDFSTKLFWLMVFVAILATVAYLFVAKAVRHMEISVSSPMLNFGPAITAVLAFLVLGEGLSLLQVSGITLILVGAYVVEVDHKISNLKDPFIKIVKSRYMHYIFLALAIYGVTSVIDRYVLTRGVNPYTYLFFVHVFVACFFLVLISVFHDGFKGIRHGYKSAGRYIFLVAAFTFAYRLFQLFAVSMAFVALVTPIKRISTLITTIVGGKMFHEAGLHLKVAGCVIMVFGVVLIIL